MYVKIWNFAGIEIKLRANKTAFGQHVCADSTMEGGEKYYCIM
jgi:hypothetical protein